MPLITRPEEGREGKKKKKRKRVKKEEKEEKGKRLETVDGGESFDKNFGAKR